MQEVQVIRLELVECDHRELTLQKTLCEKVVPKELNPEPQVKPLRSVNQNANLI